MENNKYYTPTLNDFAEGLEYEWKFTSEGYTPFTHSFKFILPDLQNIRVKYLDQSDIESLGWKFENTKNSFFTKKILNAYKIVKESGFNTGTTYTLEQLDNNLYLISSESYSSYGGETYKMVFNLNNKSELIKLMQQLNINNNVQSSINGPV